MNDKPYDVIAIGNAIVDILCRVDEDFIRRHNMPRNDMRLVDRQRSDAIFDDMENTYQIENVRFASGGSAANSLAAIAQLGGKAAFIGRVRDDAFGETFRENLRDVGVRFDTPSNTDGESTAKCLIAVTGDAERTMNTYLGAAGVIFDTDIDEDLIKQSKIVLGEGYMWDKESTKQAIEKAFAIAKANGGKVAFTTSALFCIENHREDFQRLIDQHIDILFCNDDEARALYPELSWDEVLDTLQRHCQISVVTRGPEGAIVLTPEKRYDVPADAVTQLVDTTGAGDMFAGAFLYALTKGHDLETCAKLGNACAAQVIQKMGARIDHHIVRAERDRVCPAIATHSR